MLDNVTSIWVYVFFAFRFSEGWFRLLKYFRFHPKRVACKMFSNVLLHMHSSAGFSCNHHLHSVVRYTKHHIFNIPGYFCPFHSRFYWSPPTPITTSFGNTLKWFQVFYHSVFSLLLCCAKLRNFLVLPSLGKKGGRGKEGRQQMDDDLKRENRNVFAKVDEAN